jgi:5-methylcytosine-specific restriction enzyme subunit McrC
MMRYNPKFNPYPQRRRSPTPRPDYIVMDQRAICSILDAKYRDLWEKSLPREMLYQLVVYAISLRQCPQSTILYPDAEDRAKQARIDVTDPLYGRELGQVWLRPVSLPKIEKMVTSKTAQARREREAYAQWLAFGEERPLA